ncbi:uncharacterized protein LOC126664682 isoform X1 [Mercurialis annua]|uniref:uncharacterized protein LOC126664682 isoform X1 n=1 Tax=Mercurialis annua TaxID=3986 RepID=UPI0021601F89|nr:uncharacterized protein LOC126664682 isoform X1 [Mercurialis annua]
MVAIQQTTLFFSSSNILDHLPNKSAQRYKISTLAKKKDLSDDSTTQQHHNPFFPLVISNNNILIQSAIAVFGLGFIDAGIQLFRYSGDWSRIGVISKESEDLLKFAAFLVIPFCIFLIYSISKQE